MDFGYKLKKLRTDCNMTQEDLAERIFVTRTAISKWETGKGFPAIDSLMAISKLFDVSIDDLISDDDIRTKRLLDKAVAQKFYICALICLAAATLFSLLTYFLQNICFSFGSITATAGYIVFAILSKPKYKRMQAKKFIVPYVISRAVILAIILSLIIYTILQIA